MSLFPSVQCEEFDVYVHQDHPSRTNNKAQPFTSNGMNELKCTLANVAGFDANYQPIVVVKPRQKFFLSPDQAKELEKWMTIELGWSVSSFKDRIFCSITKQNGCKAFIVLSCAKSSLTTIQEKDGSKKNAGAVGKRKKSVSYNVPDSFGSQQELTQDSQSFSQMGPLSQLWGAASKHEDADDALEKLLKGVSNNK